MTQTLTGIKKCTHVGVGGLVCGDYGGKMVWEGSRRCYVCVNCGHTAYDRNVDEKLRVIALYQIVQSQSEVSERLGVPIRRVYYYVQQQRQNTQPEAVSRR